MSEPVWWARWDEGRRVLYECDRAQAHIVDTAGAMVDLLLDLSEVETGFNGRIDEVLRCAGVSRERERQKGAG